MHVQEERENALRQNQNNNPNYIKIQLMKEEDDFQS